MNEPPAAGRSPTEIRIENDRTYVEPRAGRRFLRKELGRWAKRLPDEFYESMYRLRGWDYEQSTTARPAIVGKFTPDLVYARLAPGVPERLKLEPKDKGRRKHHPHRRCTGDVGHPALKKRSFAVNASMRANANLGDVLNVFVARRSRAAPAPCAYSSRPGIQLAKIPFRCLNRWDLLPRYRPTEATHPPRQDRPDGDSGNAKHSLSWHISSAR